MKTKKSAPVKEQKPAPATGKQQSSSAKKPKHPSTDRFTRIMAVATVIKGNKSLSKDEIIAKADELYHKVMHAPLNHKETTFVYTYCRDVLQVFDIIPFKS